MLKGQNHGDDEGNLFLGNRQRSASNGSSSLTGVSARRGSTRRKRADSTASRRAGTSISSKTWTAPPTIRTSSTLSNVLPDYSQATLDKVLQSRLTDTFVAISVPADEFEGQPPEPAPQTPGNGTPSPSGSSFPRKQTATTRIPNHRYTTSTPIAAISDTLSPSPMATGSGNDSASGISQIPLPPTPRSGSSFTLIYLSPIHQPSTNPHFDVNADDFRLGHACTQLKVEVFGKQNPSHRISSLSSEKGKEKASGSTNGNTWRVLKSWTFDLAQLVPLSADVCRAFSQTAQS
jgi:UV radiation resistance-associated gene protein